MKNLEAIIQQHLRQRSDLLPSLTATFPNLTVEGCGYWPQHAYLPALQLNSVIPATFTYDSNYGDNPPPLDGSFRLHDKASRSPQYPITGPQSAVVIATPDIAHMPVAASYAGKVPLILVEKPFAAEYRQIDELKDELISGGLSAVFGVDHYLLRLAAIKGAALWDVILEIYRLAGQIHKIMFRMTETDGLPSEPSRLKTLQFGIGLDMMPHAFAMLSALAPINTFDDIQIIARYRYRDTPASFLSETGLELNGTIRLFDGRRIPVDLLAAKGWHEAQRKLVIQGDQNEICIDLTTGRITVNQQAHPAFDDVVIVSTVEAYRWLLEGICRGLTGPHSWGLLTLLEADTISRHLENMWRAARSVSCATHVIGFEP